MMKCRTAKEVDPNAWRWDEGHALPHRRISQDIMQRYSNSRSCTGSFESTENRYRTRS